jgi:hypothetical protein
MIDTKTLTKADLIQFTGSEHWYHHAMVRDVLYTDGVKYVAETAGAYWLIDEIAFASASTSSLQLRSFKAGNSKSMPTTPPRSPAKTATAAPCSPRKSNTPISHLRRSPNISSTTPSCCRASIDQEQGRAAVWRPFPMSTSFSVSPR